MSNPSPTVELIKVYTTQASLETAASLMNLSESTQLEIKLDIGSRRERLATLREELTLQLTVTATANQHLVYVVKVYQAGCFSLQEMSDEQTAIFLNTTGLSILYPYAAQLASQLILQAGFSPLHLMPMNFERMYAEKLPSEAQADEVIYAEVRVEERDTREKSSGKRWEN